MKKILIGVTSALVLQFAALPIMAGATGPDPQGPQWDLQFNDCFSETLSLAEVRDQCQDSLANSRFEIDEPPHTVTHCPSNNKPDKGKKPFSPNEFCNLGNGIYTACAEDEVEINCAWKFDFPFSPY